MPDEEVEIEIEQKKSAKSTKSASTIIKSKINSISNFSPAKPRKEITRRQILLRYPEYEDSLRIRIEGWVNIKRIGNRVPPPQIRKPELWKYRYCELERNCLFQYRMTPKDQFVMSKESVIECGHESSTILTENQLGYEFTITNLELPAKKKISFAALSSRELSEWQSVLESAIHDESIRKKGTLFCRSSFLQKWKPFDVLLAGTVIQLFSRDHQHAFNLYNSLLSKSPHYKNVLTLANNTETIFLYIRFDSHFHSWYQKLEQEITVTNHSSDNDNEYLPNFSNEMDTTITPAQYISFRNDIKELLGRGKEDDKFRVSRFQSNFPDSFPVFYNSDFQVKKPMDSPYLILSLDGGGLRGIISLVILEIIQKEFPNFMDLVSFFAGTSTGSIIASGLAFGHSPATMRTLFEKKGSDIFGNPLSRLKSVSQAKFDVSTKEGDKIIIWIIHGRKTTNFIITILHLIGSFVFLQGGMFRSSFHQY